VNQSDWNGIIALGLAGAGALAMHFYTDISIKRNNKLQTRLESIGFYDVTNLTRDGVNFDRVRTVFSSIGDSSFSRYDFTSLFLPEYESFFGKRRQGTDFKEAIKDLLLEPRILEYIKK